LIKPAMVASGGGPALAEGGFLDRLSRRSSMRARRASTLLKTDITCACNSGGIAIGDGEAL
jgi:hypothetical protein